MPGEVSSKMLPVLNLYTCKEAMERLNDYVDRELSPREMQLVKRHLKICHECTKRFAFEEDVIRQVRSKLESLQEPEGLMARLSQKIYEDKGD